MFIGDDIICKFFYCFHFFWSLKSQLIDFFLLLFFSLVDCFLVAMAPVAVSMSPTGDFLATAHVDSLGIYLWSEPITLQPVDTPTNQIVLNLQ